MKPSTPWKANARLGSMLAVLAALATPGVIAAQGGTITGTVTVSGRAEPIPGALVTIVGSTLGTQTDAQGKYAVRGVPTGRVEVRVLRIGFAELKQPVTVTAGASVTLDFALAETAIRLQEIVTTATGVQRRIELGNTIATLGDVNQRVEQRLVTNMSDLLVAKTPGMSLLPGNNTGAPPVIRIRGLNSISLNNAPIFVIDGVRMNSAPIGTGATFAATSALTSLNPQEIEDIEIVKGPSAATLYGTDAANGVIVITTKQGRAGTTRWSLHAEAGRIEDRNNYLPAYALLGHTATAASARCLLIQVAAKTCTVDSTSSLNVMNTPRLSPLDVGDRYQYGLQTSGGTDAVRFFVSADLEDETGPYKMPGFSIARLDSLKVGIRPEWLRPEHLAKQNVRLNVSAALSPKFDLTSSVGFAKVSQRVPGANNGFFSVQYQSMTGPGFEGPGPGYTAKGQLGEDLHGYNGYVPSEMNQIFTEQDIQRIIGSFNASWRPFTWMHNVGTVGIDLSDRMDLSLCRYGECPVQGTQRQGRSVVGHTNDRNFSAKLMSTMSWRLRPWADLKSTVGADYINIENDMSQATGNILPPGAQRPQDGAIPSVSGTLATATKTLGVYVEEQLGVSDRLFLTAAVRSDQNSAFGTNFQSVLYPKLSMSYVISDEPFFPKWSLINQIRLRSAYGQSGVQPGPTAALITFAATNLNVPSTLAAPSGIDTPGLRSSDLGNPNLKPETSAEFEGGFDARILDSRVSLELTYFRKQTKDALIQQPIAPSAAPSNVTVLRNLGAIRNSGFEAVLQTTLMDRRNFGWDMTVAASHVSNIVLSLGFDAAGLPNRTVGTGNNRDSVGTSVNGWHYRPYTFRDVNGDGVLSPDEVTVGATFAYYGYSQPRDIVSIQNGFDLFQRKLRINAMFDYKGGYSILNQTANIQCAQSNSCPGASKKDATLAQQAANIATRNSNPSTALGFLESGQYWRFRELSASLTLPKRLASAMRAQDAVLTFAGRNLALWTNYTGPDPEANYSTTDVQSTYSTSGQRTYFTLKMVLHF
jgi:TonB-linked SusC/RagA family outer membrane protein